MVETDNAQAGAVKAGRLRQARPHEMTVSFIVFPEGGNSVLSKSSRPARAIVVATCLVTGGLLALHFVMTFLFVAPPNPISVRAHGVIGSYMLPYFNQDWKLFAPNPAKTDPHVLVRAKIVDPQGQQQVTSWLDVTESELVRVRGHLLPDRVSRLTPKVAQSLSEAAARQEQAAPDQQQQPPTPQQTAQEELNSTFAQVLATRAARAQWGEQVREIQIRFIGFIPPAPPFFGPQPTNDPPVVQRDLPWSPARPVTPAELTVWKEIHQ